MDWRNLIPIVFLVLLVAVMWGAELDHRRAIAQWRRRKKHDQV